MKDLVGHLKKKITQIFNEFSADEYRIRVIIDRMESLVKTSSTEDIKIKKWDKYAPDYEDNKENWAFSPQEKTIYYPVEGDFAVTKLRDEHIISILLHEISHSKFTSKPEITFPEPKYAFVQMINAFEDVRVEKKLMREYPGTYDSFKNFSDILEQVVPKEEWMNKPDYLNYLLNVVRTEWEREKLLKNDRVSEVYKNTEQAIEKAIESKNTFDMINNVLVPDVWPFLKQLIPPQMPNKSNNIVNKNGVPKQQIAGQPPQNQQGSGNKKQDKEGEDEEQKQQGNGNQQDNQNFRSISNIKEIIEKAANKDNMPYQPPPLPQQSKQDKDEEDRKKAKATIKVYGSNTEKKKYEELYATIAPYIHYFAKKLNSIMTDNQLKREGGAFRSGVLNSKKLYKWKCRSNRIFAKDIFRLHRAYSVTLLIDESGSMDGNPILNASLSAVLLAEVLDFVGIPFEIVGFNATTRVYKKINEPFNWSKKRNMENIIPAASGNGSGSTNDAYSINRSVHRLKHRIGERIIIVLTDGSTNPPYNLIPKNDREGIPSPKKYMSDLDLKEEVHSGGIKNVIIGVGINTDYVKEVYPQHTCIYDVKELPQGVLSRLKSNIKRG